MDDIILILIFLKLNFLHVKSRKRKSLFMIFWNFKKVLGNKLSDYSSLWKKIIHIWTLNVRWSSFQCLGLLLTVSCQTLPALSFMEKKNKSAISSHIFCLFNKKKMKHESFKSHLNQQKQRQQKKKTIYYISTLSKFEKQHSLNKRHFSLKLKHAPQRTSWPETSASSAVYQNNPSIDRGYIDLSSDQ